MIDYIDGENRLIYLDATTVNASIHPIEIYREVRTFRKNDESLRKYNNFMKSDGNIPKGGGKFTERYFTLLEGARIVPYDISHVLSITGTLLTDDGQEGVFAFNRLPLTVGVQVDIQYIPPQVEVININSDDIVYSSFQEAAWIDVVNGATSLGTDDIPNGNSARPVKTLELALEVLTRRGFNKIVIIGSLTIASGADVSSITIQGSNPTTTMLTIETGAITNKTYIRDVYFQGAGVDVILRNCSLGDITDLSGYVEYCAFSSSTYEVTDGVIFANCFAGPTCNKPAPIIDLTNAIGLGLRGIDSSLKIINKTTDVDCEVNGITGEFMLDSTVTNGTFTVYGAGHVNNQSTGNAVVIDRTTGTPQEIAQAVLDEIA